MKIIVVCETSQVVTAAFRRKGHEAYSLDILPTEGNPAWHIQEDMFQFQYRSFDMAICHPDCTALSVSGNGTYASGKDGYFDRIQAVENVKWLWHRPIPKICIENPIGVLSSLFLKPSQYIHPWQFGHGETKKTCLWLKNLSPLTPTAIVPGREQRIWKMGPSPQRKTDRSRTYTGWGDAMAAQWG